MKNYQIKCTNCHSVLILLNNCQNPDTPNELAVGTECGICGAGGDQKEVIEVE